MKFKIRLVTPRWYIPWTWGISQDIYWFFKTRRIKYFPTAEDLLFKDIAAELSKDIDDDLIKQLEGHNNTSKQDKGNI